MASTDDYAEFRGPARGGPSLAELTLKVVIRKRGKAPVVLTFTDAQRDKAQQLADANDTVVEQLGI